jgi:hypothetical protein
MSSDLRKKVQIGLFVVMAVAAVRLVLIWHERRIANLPRPKPVVRFEDDYYVTPKKLYAYDLASARAELTHQPVWARVGYRFAYYSYDLHSRHADFRREAGLLGPIEKLQVTDVVLDRAPAGLERRAPRTNPNEFQVMAVFAKDGKEFAVVIGVENKGDYTIAPEMFFLQDPHDLYRWSKEMWQAVELHQAEPGMNEFQAGFALGVGLLRSMSGSTRILEYPNGGHPIEITFENGHAIRITPQT